VKSDQSIKQSEKLIIENESHTSKLKLSQIKTADDDDNSGENSISPTHKQEPESGKFNLR
jgi:hypothetical protein